MGSNGEDPQISVPSPRQIPLIKAPGESCSYLHDLVEDLPKINCNNYSETLGNKLDRVLDNQTTLFSNQKVIFSFMSQLIREMHNISKLSNNMHAAQQNTVPPFSLGSGVDFPVDSRDQNLPFGTDIGGQVLGKPWNLQQRVGLTGGLTLKISHQFPMTPCNSARHKAIILCCW